MLRKVLRTSHSFVFFSTSISFCPMEPLNHDEFHIFRFESNGSNFSLDLT